MAHTLTPRGRALRWCTRHTRITEQPPASNTDRREDGIRHWQIMCAGGGSWLISQPWCGVYAYNALKAAGVQKLSSRLASVALIEDDAKAKRGPFRGWTTNPAEALRGDLVVLFGRGVHVAVVRKVDPKRRVIFTSEGNTSSGVSGSQDNGGGSYRRVRPFSAVRGIALIDYPDK